MTDQPHVMGEIGYVPLRARDGTVKAWALVDVDDMAAVAEHRWHLHAGRPCRNVGERHDKETLAQRVLGVPPRLGVGIVHLDGNPLNCCRANLALNKRCLVRALQEDPAAQVLVTQRAVARLTGRRVPTRVAAA